MPVESYSAIESQYYAHLRVTLKRRRSELLNPILATECYSGSQHGFVLLGIPRNSQIDDVM